MNTNTNPIPGYIGNPTLLSDPPIVSSKKKQKEHTPAFKRHTLSLFVANKPGVLIRIALVFARRGYNIDSLVVSESKDARYSTMNIVATGDELVLDQILKQLNKLVDVIRAHDRTEDDIIQKELALYKIQCTGESRMQVLQLAHAMGCETTDVSESTVILLAHGHSEQLDSISQILEQYGVIEMVRTGKVLMARGEELTS
ncbi:acetolactate synthase small subunit [Spirochaeta lutea]|uniref:acetolactate synthase small subunit n=1 Tax=Spirochaeta lutea TaxID=1480694 RepID=UPI00069180C6|nr:acetolactate synthase small subunit [Spirochaeta lutea]